MMFHRLALSVLLFLFMTGTVAQATNESTAERFGIVIGSPTVNIRQQPDVRSAKTGTIDVGEVVPILELGREETISGKKGRWMRTSHRECDGWVFGGFAIGPLPDSALDPICKPTDGSNPRLISEKGIGAARLGMTLAQVANVWPGTSFRRTSDGDRAALVEIRAPLECVAIAYSDEANADAAVDLTRPILNLETFDPLIATAEGIHPGSPLADVEKVYGKLTKVTLSEIESRQYVEFAGQPAWLTLRLNYTGIFEGEARETTRIEPNARLWSISVTQHP